MANATKFVDNINGNNGNTGNSEAQAYADIATALAAISGAGNIIYPQNVGLDYTITTALAISIAGDVTNGRNRIEGYTTVPGAKDGRPTITCATNGVNLFTASASPKYWSFSHMNWKHTAVTTRGNGYHGGSTTNDKFVFDDLVIDGCAKGIFDGFGLTDCLVRGCWIKNCTSHGFENTNGGILTFAHNRFDSNGGSGISSSFASAADVVTLFGNRFYNNTARGFLHTYQVGGRYLIRNNQFRANGTDGMAFSHATLSFLGLQHDNNYYHLNGAYGINFAISGAALSAFVQSNENNYFGSGGQINTLGARNNLAVGYGDGTFSGDPNTAAANVALNNTANAGAVLRAAAYPITFPGGETNYADVGPVRHQDAGGTPTIQNRGLATGGRL